MRIELNNQIIESDDATNAIATAIVTFGPEYTLAQIKTWAETFVNSWANEMVVNLKILEPELFYVAMISNIAFRLLEWNSLGKPEELDPNRFMVTVAEAQAYSETSQPEMTPATLLALQEQKWTQMQQGFALIVYKRRKALELLKVAQSLEDVEEALLALS